MPLLLLKEFTEPILTLLTQLIFVSIMGVTVASSLLS